MPHRKTRSKHGDMIDPPPSKTPTPEGPTHPEVAQRAYAIWLQEGRPDGQSVDHWLMAELLCEEEYQKEFATDGDNATAGTAEKSDAAVEGAKSIDGKPAASTTRKRHGRQAKSR